MQRIETGTDVHVILTEEQIKEIDRIGSRYGNRKRAETIRRLLDFGIDVYRDFERVGIVQLVDVADRTRKAIQEEIGQQSLFGRKKRPA